MEYMYIIWVSIQKEERNEVSHGYVHCHSYGVLDGFTSMVDGFAGGVVDGYAGQFDGQASKDWFGGCLGLVDCWAGGWLVWLMACGWISTWMDVLVDCWSGGCLVL